MTHLDIEIQLLKEQLIEMQRLVRSQLNKSKTALVTFDSDLVREVLFNEKRVNSLELKIDRDCENILALFNPVAIDLRFVLATLKINANLERIGDNAEGIARYVQDVTTAFPETLLKEYRVEEAFDAAVAMMDDALDAFIKEDTSLARRVFIKDDILDEINRAATQTTIKYIDDKKINPIHYLNTLSIIRKFERVGDQTKNIAEEIIFFLEAKVLKHGKKL
jgi:phosphate transport system protein